MFLTFVFSALRLFFFSCRHSIIILVSSKCMKYALTGKINFNYFLETNRCGEECAPQVEGGMRRGPKSHSDVVRQILTSSLVGQVNTFEKYLQDGELVMMKDEFVAFIFSFWQHLGGCVGKELGNYSRVRPRRELHAWYAEEGILIELKLFGEHLRCFSFELNYYFGAAIE